jgi:hypothetical protein
LIQGVLVRAVSKTLEAFNVSQAIEKLEEDMMFSTIKDLAPSCIRNDENAIEDFDRLIRQIRGFGIPVDELEIEIFTSILNSLESIASKYAPDQSHKNRIFHMVEVVNTYLSKECDR